MLPQSSAKYSITSLVFCLQTSPSTRVFSFFVVLEKILGCHTLLFASRTRWRTRCHDLAVHCAEQVPVSCLITFVKKGLRLLHTSRSSILLRIPCCEFWFKKSLRCVGLSCVIVLQRTKEKKNLHDRANEEIWL